MNDRCSSVSIGGLLYEALRLMYLVRYFEEKAEELYALGKIHSTMHLFIGQEAAAVGACLALRPDDYILSAHRGHGHCIGKGADIKPVMAEFMGKATGCGDSMHIADVAGGNLGANGVVGGGLPIASGVGLGLGMLGPNRVCLCFFGDSAANEGAFHESLNLASIWALPVVFLCENNQYALSMPFRGGCAIERVSQRAAGYGIPGETVDGNDLVAVYRATRQATEQARRGGGGDPRGSADPPLARPVPAGPILQIPFEATLIIRDLGVPDVALLAEVGGSVVGLVPASPVLTVAYIREQPVAMEGRGGRLCCGRRVLSGHRARPRAAVADARASATGGTTS